MQTIELTSTGAHELIASLSTLREIEDGGAIQLKLVRIRAGDPSGQDGNGWDDPEVEIVFANILCQES